MTTTFASSIKYQFDTDDNAIDSASGKIGFVGSTYAWYGLNFGGTKDFCGVSTKSSLHIITLNSNRYIFSPYIATVATLGVRGSALTLDNNCIGEARELMLLQGRHVWKGRGDVGHAERND